jgi:hypothetical protein
MINELVSRPNIQQFLNKYPSSRWKELITDLFEIGVLNLKNSYNRYQFSRNELCGILYDLENSSSAQAPLPTPKRTPSYDYRHTLRSNPRYPQSYDTQDQRYAPRYDAQEPNYPSRYDTQDHFYQKYLRENINDYQKYYNFERRRRRLNYLENRAKPKWMDAFYSERNETPKKESITKKGKRGIREIEDKILMSKQYREIQRDKIHALKQQHLKEWKKEKERKRREKMMLRQAEEDMKEEEIERRRKIEEDEYQEGYLEDHKEEEDDEEEEETDKFHPARGVEDDEEEEEEEEEKQDSNPQGGDEGADDPRFEDEEEQDDGVGEEEEPPQ